MDEPVSNAQPEKKSRPKNPRLTCCYDLVAVRWDDAKSDSSWQDLQNMVIESTIALTIGFVVSETDDYIVLADSYFEQAPRCISNTTQIPKGMIQSLMVLKKKKSDAQRSKQPPL